MPSIKRIAFFVHYMHPLKICPSIVHSIEMLAEQGYEVDIFKCETVDEVVSVPGTNIVHVSKSVRTINPFKRALSVIGFIVNSYKYCRDRDYVFFIAFDPYGLIIASVLAVIFKTPVAYYSIEILTPSVYTVKKKFKALHWLHYALIKRLEKFFHRRSVFTIIQDEKRAELLSNVNGVNLKGRTFLVPNSPMKGSIDTSGSKGNYLRNKYSLSEQTTIIFYAGQISKASGIEDLIKAAKSWPPQCIFFIHGFGQSDYIKRVADNPNQYVNVILSQDLLEEHEYTKMIESADIGIVWRTDTNNPNSFIMGAASGKMFHYLKCGLPIITNKLPGLTEIVEASGCGICLDDKSQVGDAISRILQDYSQFRGNAFKCFEEYEFSKHYQGVIDTITGSGTLNGGAKFC